jgi:TP901 family phage tail tape measure protein
MDQLIGSLKKMATDLAAMDDIYADVRKYTGMTLEEVKALNEEFKKLDTRTAREQLNKLAGDAGRLGIQSKEKILEFVDAADKINVALGEDLGEDAVKNIGKMAEMFGESDRMGLRAAMLSTGSAINTLAQTSSASEPYLMEFTARLSGAANQANITQAEVLGFASVLDQNMQKLEMSATALQNLIMKMMQNPAKFAKMAGVEVSKFSELLKTDANEAILTLIDSLNKKGGLSELAPIFKDMGLDGVRASGVISVLAGNIDKVREEQSKANKAYQEGTSVVDEYNIKNNNLQAQLEKARKRFQDMKLELGEKLYPILLKLTKTSTVFIKMLPKLIDFFVENKKIIIAMAAAYAALILIQSKKTILDKLELIQGKLKAAQMLTETISTNILALAKAKLSGNTLAAANAQKALKLAFASTPWGFVIVAIGAIVMALSQFIKNQNELSHSQKVWNEIATETTATYEKETIGVNKLIKAIHNENLSNEARQAAINELKQIIPGYNAMINDEGKIINENTQAIEDYLTSLKKKIKLQSVESQLKTAYEEEAKASKEAKQALKEYDEQAGIFFVDKLTKGWKSEKKSRIAGEAYQLVQELEAEFDKLYQETLTDPPEKTTPDPTTTDYLNKNYNVDEKYADKYAAYLEKLAALRERYRLNKLSAFDKEIEETKIA